MYTLLSGLEQLSIQGNNISTSSFHRLLSSYLTHTNSLHIVRMYPTQEENDDTKVTGWSTDHLCGYHLRNMWLSPITWTCCVSLMYTNLSPDGCDLIGISITLCTWSINQKHFAINHINSYEDVYKQYHLMLQLFFSYFFPLKAEVIHTTSIRRPLPPCSWNDTPNATS